MKEINLTKNDILNYNVSNDQYGYSIDHALSLLGIEKAEYYRLSNTPDHPAVRLVHDLDLHLFFESKRTFYLG